MFGIGSKSAKDPQDAAPTHSNDQVDRAQDGIFGNNLPPFLKKALEEGSTLDDYPDWKAERDMEASIRYAESQEFREMCIELGLIPADQGLTG